MKQWKVIKTHRIFENEWISLDVDDVVRPNGKIGQYSVLNTSEVVAIVAINQQSEICIINLHRYPYLENSWEIIKGRTDGEEPRMAAKRELKEETGFNSKILTKIGTIQPLNGLVREITHVFLAKDLKQTNINEQDEEGINKIKTVSWKTIEEMIYNNEITDGQTISALYKVKLYLENKNG